MLSLQFFDHQPECDISARKIINRERYRQQLIKLKRSTNENALILRLDTRQ